VIKVTEKDGMGHPKWCPPQAFDTPVQQKYGFLGCHPIGQKYCHFWLNLLFVDFLFMKNYYTTNL
jgi:hypothetical protein